MKNHSKLLITVNALAIALCINSENGICDIPKSTPSNSTQLDLATISNTSSDPSRTTAAYKKHNTEASETTSIKAGTCDGDYGALATAGEIAYKNYRGSGTYGVYFTNHHRFKVTGEWLTQKLTYHFNPGRAKEWVSQYALGGEYQYLIGNKIVHSINLGSGYVHSYGQNLPRKHIFNKVISRHIANSDGALSFLGTTVRLWNCARLSINANYDWVKYHQKYNSGKLANGFGGSLFFVQPFATDFTFELSAEFRKPFNSYQGSLNWKRFFSRWGIDLGIFGNITDGREGLPDIKTVGLQLGFSFGGKGCKNPPFDDKKTEQTDSFSRAYCNVSDWALRPAVYVPIVLTLEDSKKQ